MIRNIINSTLYISIVSVSIMIPITHASPSVSFIQPSQLITSLDQARIEVLQAIESSTSIYQESINQLSKQYATNNYIQSLQCLWVLDVKNMLAIASGNYETITKDLFNDYIILSNRINEITNRLQLWLINKEQANIQYMTLEQDIKNFKQKYLSLLQQLSSQFITTYSWAQSLINWFVSQNLSLLNELQQRKSLIEPYMNNMSRLNDLIRQSAIIVNWTQKTGDITLFTDLKTTTLQSLESLFDRTIRQYNRQWYIWLSTIAQDYKQSLLNEYSIIFDDQFVNTYTWFTTQRTIDQLKAVQTIIISQLYSSWWLNCGAVMSSSLNIYDLISPVTPILTKAVETMNKKMSSLNTPESLNEYRKSLWIQLQSIYATKSQELEKKLTSFLINQTQWLDARSRIYQQSYQQLLSTYTYLNTLDTSSKEYVDGYEMLIEEAKILYKQSVTKKDATQIRSFLRSQRRTTIWTPLRMNASLRRIEKVVVTYIETIRSSLTLWEYVNTLEKLRTRLITIPISRNNAWHSQTIILLLDEINHALHLAQ